jgi:23S rRNA pseudouridine2604 synthase
MKLRINKVVADRCEVSRRKADQMIRDGRVTVNGKEALLGSMLDEQDEIYVDGSSTVHDAHQRVVIALHKPIGYITTTDQTKTDTVMDLVNWQDGRLFPVGRLDVESSGLILLTNDGKLANELMHPRYEHEKEYEVEVDRDMLESDILQLRHGLKIDDRMTKPAQVLKLSDRRFRIMIQEGRNRQIRRMCETLHYHVLSLKRIRIAGLELGSLKPGMWRVLTPKEVKIALRDDEPKRKQGEKVRLDK